MTVRKIKSIGDIPYPIDVGADALSPLLTAGAALGITGNDAEESAWLARTSGADGVASVKSIHGRTLRWNQLVALSNNTSTVFDTVTRTRSSDGSVTFTGTAEGTGSTQYATLTDRLLKITSGHKYFLTKSNDNLAFYVNVSGSNNHPVAGSSIFTALENSDAASIYITIPATGYDFGTYVCYPQLFDLTAMFGAGSEPATVAEFEALYPLPYYEYDAGSLLSVNMTGIESTGFNQWDEVWELGTINANDGTNVSSNTTIRSKNHIPVFPGQTYYFKGKAYFWAYAADKSYVGRISHSGIGSTSAVDNNTITIPNNVSYLRFVLTTDYGTTYNHDICINLSDPTRNGEYEAYWNIERAIAASTYFPTGLKKAGTAYDELTGPEAITRVGEVDLGTLTWGMNPNWGGYRSFYCESLRGLIAETNNLGYAGNIICSEFEAKSRDALYDSPDKAICLTVKDLVARYPDASTAAEFTQAVQGVMLHYALATPTVTPIDPPLNMTYRTEHGGTERVIVPTGEQSAPPTIVTAQGYTAESLRDAALSAIAPVENGLASTNYAVGSYLVHGGQLCKVTTAIATGEAITIGTNVTATTVMAEVIALIAQ